jgi:hypothetical protein
MDIKERTPIETKLEKLTLFRISIVFLCEFLFEFSFGILFFIFTTDPKYYEDGLEAGTHCADFAKSVQIVWLVYLVEFSVACLCFLIGIIALIRYCRRIFTRIYISLNNDS